MIERAFSLQRFLTPIRLKYPWYIGLALWLGWLLSIIIGSSGGNNTDRFGQLIGTDFAAFYTAGEIVKGGQSARLYEPALAIEIQNRLYGFEAQNFNPYLNPPFYAWIFVPFSMLPYPISPLLWMGLNLVFLFLAIKILGINKPWHVFLLALTWIPAWSAISFGQNTFLSVLLLSLAFYFWHQKKYLAAGLISGLLLYKPQLLIGIIFIWILDWKHSWRSLLGCLVTGLFLLGSSYMWMPEATKEYFTYAQKISSGLMTHPAFPIWNAHGIFTFWLGIFPSQPLFGKIMYGITAAFGLLLFVKFYLSKNLTDPIKFGSAVLLTVWTTPYLMVYDWAILLIPAILFWQEKEEHQKDWKVIFSILWVVMLISGPLTALQWHYLDRAIQISLPILAFAIYLSNYLIQARNEDKPGLSFSGQVSAG